MMDSQLTSPKTDWLIAARRIRELSTFALLMMALSTSLQVLSSHLPSNWLYDLIIGTSAASALLHCALCAAAFTLIFKAWRYVARYRKPLRVHNKRQLIWRLCKTSLTTLCACGPTMATMVLPVVLILIHNSLESVTDLSSLTWIFGWTLMLSAMLRVITSEYRELALSLDESQNGPHVYVGVF